MNKNTTNDPFSPAEVVSSDIAGTNTSASNGSAHSANGNHQDADISHGLNNISQPVVGEGVFHGNGSYSRFDTAAANSYAGAFRPLSTPSQSDEDNVDWRKIFAMLRRRRWIMLAVFGSVVALGILLTSLTRPIYNSSSTLLFSDPVSGSSPSASAAESSPLIANLIGGAKANSRATQIAILQGPRTLGGAIKTLEESNPNVVKTLQEYSSVSADQIGETDLIALSGQSYDPQAAAIYVNAVAQQFINQNKSQSREQATSATAYLKDRLRVVRADLNAKRLAYKQFQENNHTVDPTEESKLLISQYGEIQSGVLAVEADHASDTAELNAIRAMVGKMAPMQVRPAGIRRRPVVEDLKSSLTSLELQRLKMAQEYAPQSDEIRQLDTQIKDLKERLSTEAQTEVGAWSTNPNPVRENGLQQAAVLQSKVWAQESRLQALQSAQQVAADRLKQLPDQQYRLSQLMTDLETLEATYKLLNERYIGMRLQEQTSISDAVVLTPATPDPVPVSPKKKTNLLLSIMVGLVLAVAAAVIVDNADDRVHSQQEAEQASGLSILAQIPFIKDKSQQSLLTTGNTTSILLESYRMLRTNIEFASLGKALRSITLTSTQPNEGKSTISTDLAFVMALDGRKVILLDADLRRPTLHTFFDLTNRIGFTNLIAGTATLEEALQATSVPNLFLLASGPVPPNPPELLNSKAARAVFSKLGEECDLLIVDTPPALVMTDAQIVASMTDAALLVVSMQEAGKREITRSSQSLTHTGTQVLGVVLNKATAESLGYGSYDKFQKQYYGAYGRN